MTHQTYFGLTERQWIAAAVVIVVGGYLEATGAEWRVRLVSLIRRFQKPVPRHGHAGDEPYRGPVLEGEILPPER